MKKTTKAVSKTQKVITRSATAAKPAPKKTAAAKVEAHPRRTAAPAPPPAPEPRFRSTAEAMRGFDAAVALFRAGRFGEAKAQFDEISTGPFLELAHSARLHAKMCEQRISKEAVPPRSAEDYYTLGVARLNQRKLGEAKAALEAGVQMAPLADYIHYSLAVCLGLMGDLAGAARSLQQAIALNPRNRAAAKHDPDFGELVRRPQLAELLAR